MRMSPLIILFALLSFSPTLLSQSLQLSDQINRLLLNEEPVDLKAELLRLGNQNETIAVLTEIANKNRHAAGRSLELKILGGAVLGLGELRASSASDLLSSLLTDPRVYQSVRAQAARSLGQIDPEGNKTILVKALDPSEYYLIRVYAAEGLAQTKDGNVLKALEDHAIGEKDSYVRERFQKAGQAMRANGVKPN